jgi:hypothetical protein
MKNIFIVFLCLITLSSTCKKDEEDLKLRVRNNSNSTIYMSWGTWYPDTSFSRILNPNRNPQCSKIEPQSLQDNHYNSPTSSLFNENMDTLMVFIFDSNIIENKNWDTIVKNYMILKRYDLSLFDLEGMNWTITYP